MDVLVISCSLNPGSRSAALAQHALESLRQLDISSHLLDLRERDIPLCDGATAYEHPAVPELRRQIADADAVLLAVPIYNYDINAAAKNLIELTGSAWEDKVVGFLCAAGGRGSYMSIMSLANSLMLDFRCLIVPRFVYAVDADFDPDGQPTALIHRRIETLCAESTRLAAALGASHPM